MSDLSSIPTEQLLKMLQEHAQTSGAGVADPQNMAATAQDMQPHTFGQKFAQGVGDVGYGLAQTLIHGGPPSDFAGPMPVLPQETAARELGAQGLDQTIAARESKWQGQRTAAGDKGMELARGLGSAVASAPLAMAIPAAEGGIGAAVLNGAIQGGASAFMQPVTSGDYASGKAGQIAGGTAGGAGMGLVTGGLSSVLFPKGADEKAQTVFKRALARDGYQSVEEAQARLQELGPNATIADLGPNTRGLAEAAALRPGAAVTAAEQLKARQYGQGDRLKQAALDAADVKHVDELIAKRSVAAKPLYEAAFAPQTGPVTTNSLQITSPAIERLLTRPDIQEGLQAGMKDILDEAAITGEKPNLADFALKRGESGQFERSGAPTMRMLDAAKRGLDEKLQGTSLKDQFGRPTQRWYRLDGMRQTLINNMDEMAPKDPKTGISTYKMARDAWAGPSDVIEGLSLINKTADNARDGSDITGRLFGTPAAREKLTRLFGDTNSLQDFGKTVQNERLFADTNRAITGNSRTMFRKEALNDLDSTSPVKDLMMELAQNPSQAGLAATALKKARDWYVKPPQGVADALAPMMTTDQAARDAYLLGSSQSLANLPRSRGQNLLGRASGPLGLLGGGSIARLLGN